MAHKTLIDGTAYEIDGGKAMVDGTVYEIDKGKTLVDGTAYEVGVALAKCRITEVNGSFSGKYTEIEFTTDVEWIGYNPHIVDVPFGSVIRLKLSGHSVLVINGAFVDEAGEGWMTYEYTVTKDIIVDFQDSAIYINEIRNDPATITISGGYQYSSDIDYAYIQFTDATGTTRNINGYQASYGGTYEVPAGNVITCYVESESYQVTAKIILNGTTVASKSDGDKTYSYLVTGNASINITTKTSGGYGLGRIEITET